MLISKFDLYKSEWLELVFDDRNKEYGAYNLRQNNAGDTAKAMTITFSGLLLIGGIFFICKAKPGPVVVHDKGFVVTIAPPPILHIKKPDPVVPPHPIKTEPAKQTATIKVVPPVVVPDIDAVPPVLNTEITTQISTETKAGKPGIDPPIVETPGEGGPPAVPDVSVHNVGELDVLPTPVGGEGAWSKFLSRNLRFPGPAQEEGVGGKVFLSFIIEKDGSLSDITVIRPAGHGFDEEALRVLKLAKAWKPGMQNGQPVRVKYTIPISFQVADNN